jgi:hypothetical protein
VQGGAVEQVDARGSVCALAEARSRVRLWVEVDDERALARLGKAGGKVDRGRRLADAALLVRNCKNARHASSVRVVADVSRSPMRTVHPNCRARTGLMEQKCDFSSTGHGR